MKYKHFNLATDGPTDGPTLQSLDVPEAKPSGDIKSKKDLKMRYSDIANMTTQRAAYYLSGDLNLNFWLLFVTLERETYFS